MEIRLLSDFRAFENLRDPWNKLLPQNPAQDVFYTWEWLFAWWKHYKKDRELWLITAWRADELVGIAPLMLTIRQKYGLSQRVLCSLGTPYIDVGGFIVCDGDPDIYSAICDHLIEEKEQWDVLELNELALNGPEISALIPNFKNSNFVTYNKSQRHFYLPLQGDWLSYLSRLSKNMRSDLKRKTHRIESRGKLTFKRHTGKEVTLQDISTIFKINEHGRYPYLYHNSEERSFQKSLIELTSDHGWPDLSLLFIDDHPVAYRYGLFFNNILEDWRTGFDTRYFELSVGKVLLSLVIEDCFKRSYEGIDFLRGDETYKNQWQTLERDYLQLRVVSRGRLIALITHIWLPKLKALIKRQIKRW